MRSSVQTPSAQVAGDDFVGFGQVDGDLGLDDTATPDFVAIHGSAEFRQLRRRLRLFVFPMTVVFLSWYLTYVLFAAYDHPFMNRKVVGEVNVGIIFGLLQFVSTITIMLLYSYFAKKSLDPRVEKIRAGAGVKGA